MSSNQLSHLLEGASFEWNAVYLSQDGGTRLDFAYPITPQDFLEFGKRDLRTGGMHGNVNAIANAKRAIDCQADTIVSALGYKPEKLKSQLGRALSAKIENDPSERPLPFVFKFLESIGGFAPSVVSRVRDLRHDVEHRFRKPTKKQAQESLELATLFVRATERVILDFDDSFGLGCGPLNFRGSEEFEKTLQVSINCAGPNPCANVVFWKKPFKETLLDSPKAKVFPEHESYYWLVRLALAFGRQEVASQFKPLVIGLVQSSKAQIQAKKIRVVGYR